MEYVKLLLLTMSLITVLMMSQVSARHHGRRHRHQSDEMFDEAGPRSRRGNGHGHGHGHGQGLRGFQESDNGDSPIPGFPIKGPPSAPYAYPPQQPRGPPPPHAESGGFFFLGSPNIYPQQPSNYGQQNPLATNNYPTNNQPIYTSNPFLPPGQRNIASRNNQFEDIQNLPSIEPVTNELPANRKPSDSTAKPTVNPREFDLLYGSNLYEEPKANQQNPQPDSKITEGEPTSFDDRMLLDSAPRCQEGYKLVGTKCRLKV